MQEKSTPEVRFGHVWGLIAQNLLHSVSHYRLTQVPTDQMQEKQTPEVRFGPVLGPAAQNVLHVVSHHGCSRVSLTESRRFPRERAPIPMNM